MRLLNVHTMKLEEYFGEEIPKYAILSHCWGKGEVTFQDINGPNWQGMPGFTKIYYACNQSILDGHGYVWVDTCCIDKSSSAELSEAINSMYSWYENADICYAYLEDVTASCLDINQENSEFRRSRWFTRGWTLQELLAPQEVIFFGKNWTSLGNKSGIANLVSSITRIHPEVVQDRDAVSESSVARKMSWAAGRKTTRIEDMAYSLLGIFGVSMPLLYGEGGKAFVRLQEHILKELDDQSIFAWEPQGFASYSFSILAQDPDSFIDSGDIVPIPSKEGSQSYSITNKGLHITIPLCPFPNMHFSKGTLYVALLNCQYENDFSGCLCITLFKTESGNYERVSFGARTGRLRKCVQHEAKEAKECSVYIYSNPYGRDGYMDRPRMYKSVLFKTDTLKTYGYHIIEVKCSGDKWAEKAQVLKTRNSAHPTVLQFNNNVLNHGFFVVISLSPERGFDKTIGVSLIPLYWSLDELSKRLYNCVSNNNYRHELQLPPVFNKANRLPPETPAIVVAHVREERFLNQDVTVLDFELYTKPGPFQQQKTSTLASLKDYGFVLWM